ncbi:MAG TPA: anti-sigma factor [Microlunatus sp.]|jgi:anti-sigma-K factor RskA|nr:anti-sigma factor [Microlunatus sp.]
MSDSQGYDPYGHDPHGAVGAYVADALDDDERTVFEQHLEGCESCRREVAEFTETAAELTWLSEATPPPSLRTSVLWQIAAVRPLPPEQPVEPPGSPVTGGWAAVGGTPPTDPEATVDRRREDELAVRRQRRTRRVLTGLIAAALVLVVGLGGWVSVLRGDQQNQQVATQQVNELLTAPDAQVYATTLNGAPVSFVVSKERDQALFLGDDIPPPVDGKVYQLWMIGSQITPNALVDRGGDVTQWMVDGPLEDAQQLAVTVEPAGGSPQPTTDPIAGVEL